MFQCKSTGHCIPIERVCDNITDCNDGSDEEHHMCKVDKELKHVECHAPNRTCLGKDLYMICLEISKFCDHKRDCFNGTDEGGLCDADLCFHGSSCRGSCHNLPDGPGYTCYCPPPLILSSDASTCTEATPACEQWGVCSQKCIPLKTGFRCDCEPGYTLESDGFTCKSDDPHEPYIIFSNRHEIRTVYLNPTPNGFTGKPLLTGLKNTIALDFYYSPDDMDMVFWTDVMDDKIYRGYIIMNSLTNIEVVVQTGLATAEGLAVDWIGKNLYWVESNLDQIEVARLNGSFRCTLIAGQMVSPRAIALDPRFGLIFWTDWDSELPRIERAYMDGKGRRIIHRVDQTNGAWPNGLVLDYDLQRVYWIDARSDSLNTISYDGLDFHEVLRGNEYLTHPFAVSLFGNYVYWTDWRTNSVIRANKWNGTQVKIVQRALTQPFDLKVYHPSRQPTDNITTQCSINNGGCSHLCLISLNNTYSCKCPHITKLAADNKTCLPNERVLLISRPNEIKGVDLDEPYYHTIPPINLPKVISAGEIDFDAKERKIYWADSQLNEVKRALIAGSGVETIIDTIIEHPSGFSIDWISRNLFVSSQEMNRAKIYVCNLNGEYISEIITDEIYSPQSLVVDPFEGLIIWADHGIEGENNMKESVIAMSNMAGDNITKLVTKSIDQLLYKPVSLFIDFDSTPNRLYWVNLGNSIQWVDLETRKIETIWEKKLIEPSTLTVYKDILLFSSSTDNSIHKINKDTGHNHTILRNNTDEILAMRVYDSLSQKGTNLCHINNGNCSHLCLLVSKDNRICKCAIGFSIDPKNETNCIGEDQILIYSWNWGLKGTSILPNNSSDNDTSDDVLLPPISKVLMATSIDFNYDDGFIYWVDNDDGSISRIKRDTTNFETIIHGVEKIEGFTIDWIAKNIYWIDSEYDVIEVARLNGSLRFVVLSGNMDKPSTIVVHPLLGYIFWSDNGLIQPRIERALLDGSHRTVIVNSSINIINDLAIDYLNDKIYWCDSHSDVIERMDLDGGNREVIISGESKLESPISLIVYETFIFWADTNYLNGSIMRADKDNANNTIVPIQTKLGDHVKDIQIFYKRPTTNDNPCFANNGGCQELCFYRGPNFNNSYKCACAHGKISESDNKTCEQYDAFVMFSRVTEIDSIHLDDENNLNSPYPSITNKDLMKNVIGLAFDYTQKRIIYSDIQRGRINWCFFNGTNHQTLVEKQGSVEGIVYDSFFGELYWTSNSDASINRLNLHKSNSSIEKIIRLGADDRPRGIAVDVCGLRVYWTNWNNKNPSIQRAYLSGFDVHSIITTQIKMPNGITLDHKLQKLYWTDARLDKIERCNLDGTERTVILREHPQHPFDVAVFGNWLYWTDWVAHAVVRANKFTGSEVVKLRRNVQRPMGIVAVANDTEDCTLNPCSTLNGGCEDICAVSLNGTVLCSCFKGRQLTSDGKTCAVNNSNCTKFEYQCGNGVCIPFELTCNGKSDCSDQSDENLNYCATRDCIPEFFKCNNNRCILVSKKCDGHADCDDGRDEANCACNENQFKCKDGPCIGKSFRCDSGI